MGGSFGHEDDGGEDGQRHPEVGRDKLRSQSLHHDAAPEDRLHDHEHAGGDGGGKHWPIPSAIGHDEGPQAENPDQRPDGERGDQAVGVLDPDVELGRRDPVVEGKAPGPVRAGEARIGPAHQAAHGDQDEGRDGSGDRQLGESGQHRVPLTAQGPGERARP
jgi:hypothetical protein